MTLFDHFESSTSLQNEIELESFQFDKVQFQFPSTLISSQVSNNILVLGFAFKLLWIDLERPNSITEIGIKDLEKVFLSPLANQMVIACFNGENYYYSLQTGLKLLSRVNGRISAVAWARKLQGTILLGTRGGSVYELEITSQPKFKEKSCNQVFSCQELITGLEYLTIEGRIVIFLTTSERVYQFAGFLGPQSSFGLLMNEAVDIQEMLGSFTNSIFSIFDKTFSWLTVPGIYTGTIKSKIESHESLLDKVVLIPYPTLKNQEVEVLDFATTAFHYILLVKDGCIILNRLDNNISHFIKLNLEPAEKAISLEYDKIKHTYWVSTSLSLYEIIIENEDKDIWKIYFERGMYKEALEIARDSEVKSMIAEKYADMALEEKNYELAAELFAKTALPLEQVSLRLLKIEESMRPLRLYLIKILNGLSPKHESQVIMISSWILELLLVDYDIQEDNLRLEKGQDAILDTTEITEYLKTYHSKLNTSTVYSLFNKHGRQNLALIYAEIIRDYDTLTQIYLQSQSWSEALKVIGSTTQKSLFYKHSPILIQHIPSDLITLWKRSLFLNPRMLLPAMLQHELLQRKSNEIIHYLQHMIENGNRDRVIHNYLLYLYVHRNDQELVLGFIKSVEPPLFDIQYALRICTLHQMTKACIQLYLVLEMEKEALHLALKSGDIIRAKEIVNVIEEEEELKNELWLDIAKFVITKQQDYKSAMALVREGSLKIEQILKFFPDFVLIDQVKDDLVDALRRYNTVFEQLSKELDDSANSTDLIQKDIKALKSKYLLVLMNRSIVIPILKKCDVCQRQLMTRPFHVFPCHHAFHSECLADQLIPHPIKGTRVKFLSSQIDPKAKFDLENFLGEECVLCSEIMIRTIDLEFTDDPGRL